MLTIPMYETLLWRNPATGDLVTWLAESWETTLNSVTVKLRDDAVCTDGTPITPKIVHDSYAHYISPETASRWVSTTLGGGPFTLSYDDAAGTFTIVSEKPEIFLENGVADYRTGIICPAGLAPGADFTTASYGSGPFVYSSSIQGDNYVVVKRDDMVWEGPAGMRSDDPGFPDQITFRSITNESTAANLLLSGDTHISNVTGADKERMKADPSLTETLSRGGAPYVLMFNNDPARVTTDKDVRKAIALSVSPLEWAVAAGEADTIISTNIQTNPPDGYCYRDLSELFPAEYTAAAGRQVLLDAGWTEGGDGKLEKDGVTLEVQLVGTTFTGNGVEYLAERLGDVGIKVNLVNTDYQTFAQNFGATDYDVLIGLFGGLTNQVPTSTPRFMIGALPEDGGNNRIRRDDPVLQGLVETANGAPTLDEACAAWEAFNRYVIGEYITWPWASSQTHYFTKAGEWDYIPVSSFINPLTIRFTA